MCIRDSFHDVAKGRGGDHSSLGAKDAARFAHEHGLSKADGELVAWLVEQHLVMSSTAQKQDLTDPEVISSFANVVKDERTLIALYILTVADIRGTSPAVWNAWKGKLLEDLFRSTRRVLRRVRDRREEGRGPAHLSRVRARARQARGVLEAPRRQLLPALRGGGDRVAHAHALVAAHAGQAHHPRAALTRGRGAA